MVTKTLIGLACLIANNGPSTTVEVVQELSPSDQKQVEEIIDSGVCLPSTFESLLDETHRKVERGEIPKFNPMAAPSEGCYAEK